MTQPSDTTPKSLFVLEFTFKPPSAEQTIHLSNRGLPLLTSGTWTFFHGGMQHCTAGVRWKGVDPKLGDSTQELGLRVEFNQTTVGRQQVTLDGRTSGEVRIPHQSSYGNGRTYTARLEWSMPPSLKTAAGTAQEFAQKHTALLGSPFVNSVQFVFPRDGGRELWSNADILSDASPYFKALLESGFSESRSSITHPSSGAIERSALDFEDSDDDEAFATPPSDAPASAHSSTFPHHRIEITKASFITYQAVLCWIYTDHLSWAPLASSFAATATGRSDAIQRAVEKRPKVPYPASPKSVYRLAHLLEIPALQKLALAELKSQLTVANAAAELFSETSWRYDDVFQVVLEFTTSQSDELKTSEPWTKMLEQVDELPWGGRVALKLALALSG